jgi:hypothetical protein
VNVDSKWAMNMLKRLVFLSGLSVFGLTSLASEDWLVISDVKEIAAMRKELNKPDFSFDTITIVRLTDHRGQRIDVTTVGPTVVGFEPGGAPAARSLITFVRKPDRLVLFTQDVRNWKAFRMEIPVNELTLGRSINFPVVQDSGEVVEQAFTVKELITR